MTESDVFAAVKGDPYIEFSEDSAGRGTRMRYVGKSTVQM